MHEIICTITKIELDELVQLFDEYANDNSMISGLNDYKKFLGNKYSFAFNKVTINTSGEVRLQQQCA